MRSWLDRRSGKGDAPQAAALIEGLAAEVVMADTAYDAGRHFAPSHCRRARVRSPSSPTTRHVRSNIRSTSISMPSATSWNATSQKLKQFRRVATRFGKRTARKLLALFVTLAAIMLWLR